MLLEPFQHVHVIHAVDQPDRDFPADQIGGALHGAVGTHEQRRIVRRLVINMNAGRQKHEVKTVAARHDRLIDRAGADFGAAAEYRLYGDGTCATGVQVTERFSLAK